MAVITLTILEGRDAATLARLHEAVANAVIETLDAKPHQVRTIVHEVSEHTYAVGGRTLAQIAAEQPDRT